MDKFDPKDPNEIAPLTFPFDDVLNGQSIVSQIVEVTVFSGVDATPSAILSGAATASGDRVRQNVRDGFVGVEYLVRATVTTNTGLKYTLGKILPVKYSGTW